MKNPFHSLSPGLLRLLCLVTAILLLPATALRAQIAVTVPGTSNLWLAGVIAGTTASTGQDNLTNAKPFQVPGVTLTPGTSLTFTNASGNVSNDPDRPVSVGPDGGPYLGFTLYAHDKENGIAKLVAPVNSLIGVFLDDSVPNPANTPDGYDLSQPPGTIYTLIAPALRKPFFIGDGKTDDGTVQKIIVPAGATRLFLGALDPSDQENNLGSFAVTVNGAGSGNGGGGTTGANLLVNGDAEASVGANNFTDVVTPTGWTTTTITVVRYSAGNGQSGFLDGTSGTALGGGQNYFSGGPGSGATAAATQTITIADRAADIDAGRLTATAAGLFGGFQSQGDSASLRVEFVNAGGTSTSFIEAGNVTPAERNGATTLVPRSASQTVPAGTRSLRAVLLARRTEGTYNDGYADNLSVTLSGGGTAPTGGAVLAVTDATEKSTSDATGATAVPGDTLTYSLTVRNPGSATATGISVTAVLNGIKFKSATAGGVAVTPTVDGSRLVFPKFNLPAGASVPVTVKAKVPGDFPTDGRTVGLAASSITADAPTAPLSGLAGLNSTVLSPYQTSVSYNANVGPGDVLTFRFTTTNRSAADVTGATSVIHLPDGVKFLSVNAEDGTVLNLAPNGNNDVVVPIALLRANQSVVYSVAVRVNYDTAADATLTLLNTRLLVGNTAYGEPGAMIRLNGTPAGTPPKLALSKIVPDQFNLAGLFLFDPARAAKLAAGVALLNSAALPPGFSFYTTDPASGQLVPSGTAIQTFGAAINPFIGLDETGSATGGEIRSVTTPSNKQPLTYVTFALLYENTGGASASDFNVTDRVPEGFAYVPADPAGPIAGDLLTAPYALINGVPVTPDTLQVTDNRRTLNFKVKNKLKPGQSGLILYQLQVIPSAQGGPNPGAVVTTSGARISSTSLTSEVTAVPDGAPLLVTGPLHFAFQTFTPDNNRGDVGRPAIFQFLYKNDGGKKTTDFKIKVATPAGATFASANVVSGPGADSVTALPNGGGALFNIGKVKPGQSGLVQVRFIPTAASLPANGGKGLQILFQPSLDGTVTNAVSGERPVARATTGHGPVTRGIVDPFNPTVPLLYRPLTDPTAPRLFIQRSAPLVVEFGKPFTYVIVVGNLGDRPIDQAVITDVLPAGVGIAQVVGGEGPITERREANGGRITDTITLNSGIPAHGVRSVILRLQLNGDVVSELRSPGGIYRVVDDGLYATSNAEPFLITCPPAGTRLLRASDTLALVGSDAIAAGLEPYGFDANAVDTVKKAVTANSRVTTIGGADVLTTNNGALIVPLGSAAKPANQVVRGGGPVLVTGPAGVVSNDGASLISQDGAGLVAAGAGNLINVSGLISQDGAGLRGGSRQSAGSLLAGLISQDGAGLVAAGAGNLIRGGGLNLISQDGSGVVSNDGGSLVAAGAGNLVAAGAGNIAATGYSNLIGNAGGTLIGNAGGTLIGNAGGTLLSNGGGKLIAAGGGNIISDNSAGLIGSSPGTAALVAAGAGNLIVVSGGSVINGTGSGLVAAGAGN